MVNSNPQYYVGIYNAQGPVIGDNVHVEQHFYNLPALAISRDRLLAALGQASADLRNWPSEIADIHLERAEVAEIVNWVRNADPKERLGMLLDQPGGGKTVIMHDVLVALEAHNVPTLAIKADTISGIKTSADLANRLGLPLSIEECANRLGTEGPIVVIFDQIDALSLALSRDQSALDVMLSTLARLRDITNVRLIASCRTFDLNNDVRLSTIKIDRRFLLQPLDRNRIDQVLLKIGIDYSRLLPEHQQLLRTPLHLEIYARVVTASVVNGASESYRTLQELYEAIWQKQIQVIPPEMPRPLERISAIYHLVDMMQNQRRLNAPVAALDEFAEAATYLERIGFIRRESSNWMFAHQTLFDYCYARRFVAQGKSLSMEILQGAQGLFERSQMIQVLAYLRGADDLIYLQELKRLLFANDIRVHLRLLLLGWFGSLLNPTANEMQIAHRLMGNREDFMRFFNAISGNAGWFTLIKQEVLLNILQSPDEQKLDVAILYLGTMIQPCTDEVLAYLRPHLAKSEVWDRHIAFCLSCLDRWQSAQALDMLCDLLLRNRTFEREKQFLYNVYQSNLAASCHVLNIYLTCRLANLLREKTINAFVHHFAIEQYLVGEHIVGEITQRSLQECPDKFFEEILPWFISAAMTLSKQRSQDDYPWEHVFADGWYGDHISKGAAFAKWMATAIENLARAEPSRFRPLAQTLAGIEALAVQRILVQAYLVNPEEYAADIFTYIMGDPRRFNIGEPMEDSHYDSCHLIGAVFPHINASNRLMLEKVILKLQPAWETRVRGRQGVTQLQFLKSIPIEFLSEVARRILRELKDKFPDFKPRQPQGVTGGVVGVPIEQTAYAKMSDDAWLGAMRKYNDATAWGTLNRDFFLKGGVVELSQTFAEQVKNNPNRFYRLAKRFDETISLHYIIQTLSGLADSEAPADLLFDLVRHFSARLTSDFCRDVCWSLEKRADQGVPDDLLDMMTAWALNNPDPEKELWQIPARDGQLYYNGDPYEYGINTNRGSAIRTVCHCTFKRSPAQYERVFYLLEKAGDDPSTAVRTCIISVLGPLLAVDASRVLVLFEQVLDGHPRLLQTHLVYDFLYWVYRDHFLRVRPIIESLLSNSDDQTRQAGARLICLAAFYYPDAHELEEQVMKGDVVLRRGAAQVYARNLEYAHTEAICRARLETLMNDPDEQVRTHIGETFRHLRPEHFDALRIFIEAFIESPSLIPGAEHLIQYMSPLAIDEHVLALKITMRILDTVGTDIIDDRKAAAILERDIVRLPLTVYTHTDDPSIKAQAMTLFERLLLLGSRTAYNALTDWDRR